MRLNTTVNYRTTRLIALLLLISGGLFLPNCEEKKEPQNNPLAGYITVKGSEEVLPAMMEAAYAFMDLYAKAKVLVVAGGSNPGLAAIFNDSAQIAVTTRPMTEIERKRAADAAFSVNEFKVAKDGIAVIVNQVNGITQLTVDQVIQVFTGKITNWAQVKGSNYPIRVCVWDENSGTYAYVQDSILKGKKYASQIVRFASTEDMIKYIYENSGAIGMISMARLYKSWGPLVDDIRIKAVAVAVDVKGPFVAPDEATVHDGTYPFARYIYLYTPREPKGLDAGFVTYIMSTPGQRILAQNGLVPITIPVKYPKDSL
jgi:phosphate transport system substrate-binding protein